MNTKETLMFIIVAPSLLIAGCVVFMMLATSLDVFPDGENMEVETVTTEVTALYDNGFETASGDQVDYNGSLDFKIGDGVTFDTADQYIPLVGDITGYDNIRKIKKH